ncbi:PK beta-barrel-protein domain-containing protein-like protein [Aspergillus unguis]
MISQPRKSTTIMAQVVSVTSAAAHTFSKPAVTSVKLIANHGIEGDCHAGKTVQHRARLNVKPAPQNLRQVHLIPIETLQRISTSFSAEQKAKLLKPGALGQNITTQGIDLINLPVGTQLQFVGSDGGIGPILVLTGLRHPGPGIDRFQPGLLDRLLVRDASRQITGRLAGVMSTVKQGGVMKPGMRIVVVKPAKHVSLGPV